KNRCGDPAAAPLEPDGYGPTQPQRSGDPRIPSEVVPRQTSSSCHMTETYDAPRGAPQMAYPKVSHTGATNVAGSPRFPDIEEAVLAYWESDDTFRASVEQRDGGADGANEFVF